MVWCLLFWPAFFFSFFSCGRLQSMAVSRASTSASVGRSVVALNGSSKEVDKNRRKKSPVSARQKERAEIWPAGWLAGCAHWTADGRVQSAMSCPSAAGQLYA